jgi:DNA-binding CsgD family transcriptional regulator
MLTAECPAPLESFRRLTGRQRDVLDGIAKRKTIKAIAHELGVSDSAVNQHIKTLKSTLQANSLSDLAKYYSEYSTGADVLNCRKTASRIPQVSPQTDNSEMGSRNEIDPTVTFQDALTYHQGAPWDRTNGEVIVPEVLNGADSKLARFKSIVFITVGIFAVIVLGLTSMNEVSSTLESSRPASKLEP